MIEQLFREHDSKLRGLIARAGINDAATREDIAQDAWAKLVARRNRGAMPRNPIAWVSTVARNRSFEVVERQARRREWERAAAELGRATGGRSFRHDDAVAAVATRLSLRDLEILVAAQTSKTPADLAKALGYPTPKIAQSAVSRVRQRVHAVLNDEVDVGFMFKLSPDPSILDLGPTHLAWGQNDGLETIEGRGPRSAESERAALDRFRLVEELGAACRELGQSTPLLESFADYFDRLVGRLAVGNTSSWGRALGMHRGDADDLRSGSLTILEVEPATVVMLSDMLDVEARSVALMGLGDVGLRPVGDGGDLVLNEVLLTEEEANLRMQSILEEAEARAES